MGFRRSDRHDRGVCFDSRSDRISLPETNCLFDGNKSAPAMFYYVDVSGADLQSDSFEELAMPLFDQLYNFAHWLTQNRKEAEDLVRETDAKSSNGCWRPRLC